MILRRISGGLYILLCCTFTKAPAANGLALRSNDRDDSKGVKPFSDGLSGGTYPGYQGSGRGGSAYSFC